VPEIVRELFFIPTEIAPAPDTTKVPPSTIVPLELLVVLPLAVTVIEEVCGLAEIVIVFAAWPIPMPAPAEIETEFVFVPLME
jgi:hypothetical protein